MMDKEQKTKKVTVTVPYNYDWDEELLRFTEHIEEPIDIADLTNAKVGDVYETNLGEKAVLVSTNGPNFRFIFLVTRKDGEYECEMAICFGKNGLLSGYNTTYYIKNKKQ